MPKSDLFATRRLIIDDNRCVVSFRRHDNNDVPFVTQRPLINWTVDEPCRDQTLCCIFISKLMNLLWHLVLPPINKILLWHLVPHHRSDGPFATWCLPSPIWYIFCISALIITDCWSLLQCTVPPPYGIPFSRYNLFATRRPVISPLCEWCLPSYIGSYKRRIVNLEQEEMMLCPRCAIPLDPLLQDLHIPPRTIKCFLSPMVGYCFHCAASYCLRQGSRQDCHPSRHRTRNLRLTFALASMYCPHCGLMQSKSQYFVHLTVFVRAAARSPFLPCLGLISTSLLIVQAYLEFLKGKDYY